MISVVIPVYNALEEFKQTLVSVIYATKNLSEIVIVDDCSDEETREFIETLRVDDSLDIRLIKTRNPEHSWTNASWNIGVQLATQPYIAVLNSDITLSSNWDEYLIETLEGAMIACPFERRGDEIFNLYDIHKKVHPEMIKGSCFMFKREDVHYLFPIPSELTHWCGDHFLADQATRYVTLHDFRAPVKFDRRAIITHKPSSSGRLINEEEYNKVIKEDVLNYQKMSNRNMKPILEAVFGNSSRGEGS